MSTPTVGPLRISTSRLHASHFASTILCWFHPATTLSGGNQQKVCVGRALTFRPDLLYIGEPTRGIDIYSKELILKWILKINQEYNTTVVVASGELEELVRICDRIVVMYQGKVYKVFENDIGPEELTLALYGREPDEA